MRKALMLALGFLVVFSIVLFSGVLPSSKAIAAGNSDGSGNWAKIHKPPAGPLSGAKSSLYYDDPIETTVKWNTAHTYNANETIGTGGTLLIESGGNVTINGDLWVYGNVEILGSGKLTVNGDILNGGDFYIHGSAMVTVNKAKKVVYDGDGNPYYGGIFDDTYLEYQDEYGSSTVIGNLTVSGSASITVNYAKYGGFGVDNGALITMNSPQASITVYNFCGFSGGPTSGTLTAGTLTVVNGDFQQGGADGGQADDSFAPGDNFNVVLKSTGKKPAPAGVDFAVPEKSYFTRLTLSNCTLDAGCYLSFKLNLAANAAFSANIEGLFLQGSLNGHTYTVSGVGTIYGDMGMALSLGGGTLATSGDISLGNGGVDNPNVLSLDGGSIYAREFFGGPNSKITLGGGLIQVAHDFKISQCQFTMNNPNDRIIVNESGSSFFEALGEGAVLTAGTIEIHGNFHQIGTRQGQPADSFVAGPNLTTKILGKNRNVLFDDPTVSHFGKLILDSPATLTAWNGVSMNGDLSSDLNLPCDMYYGGNLSGHTLSASNITILQGATATLGKGTMRCANQMDVYGSLVMQYPEDRVYTVNYYADGSSSSGMLTAGKLYISGSFYQGSVNGGASDSFYASGDQTAVFSGNNSAYHQIHFDKPGNSKFAHVVLLTDQIDPATVPSCRDDLIETGSLLGSLTASGGALSPAFDAGTKDYMLLLSGANSVDITAALPSPVLPAGVTYRTTLSYTVDNAVSENANITGVPYGGKKTVQITVTPFESVIDPAVYTVTVETLDPDLGSLGFPAGAVIDHHDEYTYIVDLPETAASFLWAPATHNPDSSLDLLRRDGAIDTDLSAPSTTVSLGLGEDSGKTYVIKTKAQDGTPGNTYTVTFHRRNPVSGISVSPGALVPAFSPATASYSVTIPSTVSSVTVKAARGADCSALTFDGKAEALDAKAITVNPGCTVTTVVAGTDAGGKTVTAYSVSITRAIMITGISASPGPLTPGFDPGTTAYTVSIPATVSSVKITPVKFKTGVKAIYINGKKAANITVKPRVGEKLPVYIQAVASDGKTWSPVYTVTVERAPLVTDIHVSAGSLMFSPTTLNYIVNIPADTDSVLVWADPADVKSCTVAKSTLSPVLNGSDSTTVKAVATDGKTTVTYTVIVRRSVITGIEVAGSTLSPAFDPAATFDKRTYTVSVSAATSSVTLTPDKSTDCTSLKINGIEQASLAVPLDFGEAKSVTVEGSTALGTTGKYQVNVTRAALVTKIAVGTKGISLNQAFDPKVHSYTINTTAASVVINAVKASKGVKSLTINTKKVTSFTAKPVVGGTVTVTVVATATDNKTQAIYTITINRSSPLLNLTADVPGLVPAFSPATLAYGIELPAATGLVTLTPTVNAGCTCMNDATNASGPVPLSLTPGETKTVKFTANAADKSNPVVYTVSVHRAYALTGIGTTSGTLSPGFDGGTTSYSVDVDADNSSVTITPAIADGCHAGQTDYTLSPALGQSETADITVTAGSSQIVYHVTVHRAALLTGIDVNHGTLSPSFSPDTSDYTLHVAASVESVTVTPDTTNGCDYTVVGGSKNTPYDVSVPAGDSAKAEIDVNTGGMSIQKTYTITINRDSALSGIAASDSNGELTLSVLFDQGTYQYSVTSHYNSGSSGTASAVTIGATASGKTAIEYKQDDGTYAPGDPDDNNSFTVAKPDGANQSIVYIRCKPAYTQAEIVYQVTVTWVDDAPLPPGA